MGRNEDQILADELAALGARSGGSGRLVRWVALLMRKNVREIELVVPLPFERAVERTSRVLHAVGRTVETWDDAVVRSVVKGGVGGLNPVVVTVVVMRGGERGSGVWVRAAAKEGLVKQRAGEKTAEWIAELLRA